MPYLHGVVVRKDFAEEYPEVVVAFIKAVYDAGKWIEADPLKATELMEKWTGVEKEVLYLYFSKGGHLTLDPTIKTAVDRCLDARPCRADAGAGRSRRSTSSPGSPTNMSAKPTRRRVSITTSREGRSSSIRRRAHAGLPMEIWHARDGIKTYPDMSPFLKAVAKFQATGAKAQRHLCL